MHEGEKNTGIYEGIGGICGYRGVYGDIGVSGGCMGIL